jgi:F0F1-type ATP synthase assembly protein I
LEYALSYLLYSPAGDTIMTLATLIGSSPMSLLIFTVLCVIGFIAGICMILYAAKETVLLVREIIQEKEK